MRRAIPDGRWWRAAAAHAPERRRRIRSPSPLDRQHRLPPGNQQLPERLHRQTPRPRGKLLPSHASTTPRGAQRFYSNNPIYEPNREKTSHRAKLKRQGTGRHKTPAGTAPGQRKEPRTHVSSTTFADAAPVADPLPGNLRAFDLGAFRAHPPFRFPGKPFLLGEGGVGESGPCLPYAGGRGSRCLPARRPDEAELLDALSRKRLVVVVHGEKRRRVLNHKNFTRQGEERSAFEEWPQPFRNRPDFPHGRK